MDLNTGVDFKKPLIILSLLSRAVSSQIKKVEEFEAPDVNHVTFATDEEFERDFQMMKQSIEKTKDIYKKIDKMLDNGDDNISVFADRYINFFVPDNKMLKKAFKKKDYKLVKFILKQFKDFVDPNVLNVDVTFFLKNLHETQTYMWSVVLHPNYNDPIFIKPVLKLFMGSHPLLATQGVTMKILDHIKVGDLEKLLRAGIFSRKWLERIKEHSKFKKHLQRFIPKDLRDVDVSLLNTAIDLFFSTGKISSKMMDIPVVKDWVVYKGLYYAMLTNNEKFVKSVLKMKIDTPKDLLVFASLSSNPKMEEMVTHYCPKLSRHVVIDKEDIETFVNEVKNSKVLSRSGEMRLETTDNTKRIDRGYLNFLK